MWRFSELDVKYSYFWCDTLAKCVTKLMPKTGLCIYANIAVDLKDVPACVDFLRLIVEVKHYSREIG